MTHLTLMEIIICAPAQSLTKIKENMKKKFSKSKSPHVKGLNT